MSRDQDPNRERLFDREGKRTAVAFSIAGLGLGIIGAVQADGGSIVPIRSTAVQLIAYVMVAVGFGAFGGVIRVVYQVAVHGESPSKARPAAFPLLGAIMGLFFLGFCYLFPLLTLKEPSPLRVETLMFLSLLIGMFPERFWRLLQTHAPGKNDGE